MATSWILKLSSGQLTPLNILDSSDKSSLSSGELQLRICDATRPIATIIICLSELMSKKQPVFAFLVILGISFVNEIFEQIRVA